MNLDAAIKSLAMVNEAILCPELWPDALSSIAICCNSTTAHAHMVGVGGHSVMAGRGAEGALQEYVAAGWHERNSRMARGLALTRAGIRGLITEQHVFAPEEMARDPFQNEFASAHDIDVEAGMVVAAQGGSSFVINIPRRGQVGSYSDGELEVMNRLVANMANACSFALDLKVASAVAMVETLSHADKALALLTPSGRVLHMTAAFTPLLGDRLSVRDGSIHAVNPAEDNLLHGLIARIGSAQASTEPTQPIVLRRPAGRPLLARCLPVTGAARDFLGLARVVLAIDDLGLPKPTGAAEVLRAIFALTPSEARLASRIGNGEELREAAAIERISFETARTRLKSVYAKTGTGRQAELAAMIGRIAR